VTFQTEIDIRNKSFILLYIQGTWTMGASAKLQCETRGDARQWEISLLSFLFRYSYGQATSYHATETKILTVRRSHSETGANGGADSI
jgi:hypothetical protein